MKANLASLVKKALKKDESKPDSVADILYKQVQVAVKYRKSNVEDIAILLAEAAKSGDVDLALDYFAQLYSVMINARPRAKHVFHPSTLEVDCPRMLYYEINKVPVSDVKTSKPDGKLQMIFDLGTWFHMYVQIKLKEAGVLEKAEAPVEDEEWFISGRADGILKFPSFRQRFLLEIKTIGDYPFKQTAFGALEKHRKQAGLYAKLLGIKTVIFLYFNKNNSEMREIIWDVDDALIQPQFDKMESIIEATKPPKRVCPSAKCETAKGCPYKTHCFAT